MDTLNDDFHRRGSNHLRKVRKPAPGSENGLRPHLQRELEKLELEGRAAVIPGVGGGTGGSTAPSVSLTKTSTTPQVVAPTTKAAAPTTPVTPKSTAAAASTTPTTPAVKTTTTPTKTPTTLATTQQSVSVIAAPPVSSKTSSSTTTPAITPIIPIIATPVTTPVYTPMTSFVVAPLSLTSASTSTSAAAATTSAASGSTSTSVLVGGIAAGLVGIAGLIFATMFFMRRWRQRGREEDEFNASVFRQSAILMDDEPSPYGGNARPPTMIERHIANRYDSGLAPPMPSMQYNNSTPAAYGNEYADYPPGMAPSFGPGQVMHSGQSAGGYDGSYNNGDQFVRQPSNAYTNDRSQMQRQPSNAAHLSNQDSVVGSDAQYVDLDRSSVTPYQAEQYAEINKRLNYDSPAGLHIVNETDDSPFADNEGHYEPQPPSPVHQGSRERILSPPPKLPEVEMSGRTFSPTSYDFPPTPNHNTTFNIANPGPGERFPNGLAPRSAASPAPPSPVYAVPGLARRELTSKQQQEPRPASTYTVYGDETDAYGGF